MIEPRPSVRWGADVGAPRVSFEFFPPRTAAMEESLWTAIRRLAPLAPTFVSVTYGAAGTTRDRTHQTVQRIQDEMGIPAAAHLTCVAHSRAEIEEIARTYWDAGIRHILALRGDMPVDSGDAMTGGGGVWVPPKDGFAYATDLVAALRQVANFDISVAAFPEVHPEARSAQADLDNLKRKADAGATRAITQFFFDETVFLRFRDRVAAAGIGIDLIPGVLPITNFARAVEFAGRCGASVPAWLHELFHGLDQDPETRQMVAAKIAVDLCRQLMTEGVADVHFYTLNRAGLTMAICRMLGIRPHADAAVA